MSADLDYAKAIAGLRATLEERIAALDAPKPKPARVSGPLASYDVAGLWKRVARKIERDGRGWVAIAAEIGVTVPDLSRIKAGQTVSAAKIFAVCDWAKVDPRRFYTPSRRAPAAKRPAAPGGRGKARDGRSPLPPSADADRECFTGKALKQETGPCSKP